MKISSWNNLVRLLLLSSSIDAETYAHDQKRSARSVEILADPMLRMQRSLSN